jgi:predicted AlkP superfamily phosphohydrolase/phosphomutase
MSRGRTVIVGLDGMPYRLMDGFGRDGTMPNFGALASEGVFRPMASSIPEISSVAWSSIITGTDPGEHGVFGFTDVAPGTYRLTFPNLNSLRARPFWERAGSGRAVILNVPMTYPAREMNGVLISGFVALDLERATFPRALVPWLQELDYRVDVDSQKAHQSLDFFLRDLDRTLQARIAAYRYLWHHEAWDTFVLVFTGTDRLAHFLWDAYEDRTHRHHEAFVEHFRQIDAVVGEIVQSLEAGDLLIMLSDHGFERLEQNVYVNRLLIEEGFLAFEDGAAPNVRAMAGDTRAFGLDPGRVYVNLKGRYPRGSVEPAAREAVLDDLEAIFESLESAGQPVIKRVYRGEELYRGPQAHRAPDLVLLGNAGYNLRGNMKARQVFETDVFTGKHSQADAFLLVWGDFEPGVVPETPAVSDVVHIVGAVEGNI